ncbi:PucR family transcriptional regulator [Quadrisphaera granulorum]|nr:helix-turn-helix domain-containing protein [Quadrisphaera granulorum]
MSISGLAAAAGLTVVSTGAGADRPVTGVRVEGKPGRDDGPTVLVLPWKPVRRGAPLPPLADRLEGVLRTAATAVVVVPADRSVHPPAELTALFAGSPTAVLWGPPQEPEALAARLLSLMGRASATGREADDMVLTLLEGDLDVASLTAALADALGADVTVTAASRGQGTSDGVEVAHARGAGFSGAEPSFDTASPLVDAPDGAEPPAATDVVLDLRHAGRLIGAVRLARAAPLSAPELHHAGLTARLLALSLSAHEGDHRHRAAARPALAAILNDDLAARENEIRRSRRLGTFPVRSAVFLAVVPFGTSLGSTGLQRLSREVEAAVLRIDPRAVVIEHEGYVVLVVGADLDLDRVQRTVYRGVSLPLCVGASRPVDDVRRFAGAFRQAQRAVVIAKALGWANRVATYDSLGVTRLLHQLPEYERREFTREVLGAVAGTGDVAAEGRRVLRSYRAANGNFSEAARQVFLHHNTYRQRIVRLQEQLGDFVNDPEVRLSVFVALDLHRLDNDRDA